MEKQVRKFVKVAALLAFGFAGVVVSQAPAQAAMTSYVMGVSSGTSAVNVCSAGGDLYNIKLGSAAATDFVKCFNTATLASATLGNEALLIDAVFASSATAAVGAISNAQSAVDAREGAIRAGTGISCIKSSAASVWFIRVKCD